MKRTYRILLFSAKGYDSTLYLGREDLFILGLHTEQDVIRFVTDKIIAKRKLYMSIQ